MFGPEVATHTPDGYFISASDLRIKTPWGRSFRASQLQSGWRSSTVHDPKDKAVVEDY